MPDSIKPEVLIELVKVLRTGDTSVSEEIITGHMRLAAYLAGRNMYGGNHFEEDMLSAAFFGVVQAVNWAAQGRLRDNNITPYIVITCLRFIKQFKESDRLIRIPRKTFKKMLLKSDNPQDVLLNPVSFNTYSADGDDVKPIESCKLKEPCTEDLYYEMEYQELCDSLQLSTRTRQILELRFLGYTFREIGEEFELSHNAIFLLIEKLKSKVGRIIKEVDTNRAYDLLVETERGGVL